MRRVLQGLIRGYQGTFSPDHGWFRGRYPHGFCRYQPTCSTYGHDVIGKYGVFRGGWLALRRVIRCNPWSKGGFDPVP